MNCCGTRSRWLCVLHSITSPTFESCVLFMCVWYFSLLFRMIRRCAYNHLHVHAGIEYLNSYEWYSSTVQKKTRHDEDITVLYIHINVSFHSFFLAVVSLLLFDRHYLFLSASASHCRTYSFTYYAYVHTLLTLCVEQFHSHTVSFSALTFFHVYI